MLPTKIAKEAIGQIEVSGQNPPIFVAHHMKAKKSLGQHFLTNPHTAQRIADAISKDVKTIIEVGPGPGILTNHILKREGALSFIEKDDRFAADLASKTADNPNVRVVHEDFLKVDLGGCRFLSLLVVLDLLC